jgi:hypothetical protein
MLQTFTPEIAQNLINRAKKNLAKSNAPALWKKVLKDLPIHICIDYKISGPWAYGAAFLSRNKCKYHIQNDFQPVNWHGTPKYLIIELHAGVANSNSIKQNFNLIAHELAHCLDFIVTNTVKSDKHCHDFVWDAMNKFMHGKSISRVKVPLTKKFKQQIENSIASFGGSKHLVNCY